MMVADCIAPNVSKRVGHGWRVLAANPDYPEALYVRGLINLMGLHRPKAAERDFSGYLAVAPFGSHRTAAVTLLALAHSQDHR